MSLQSNNCAQTPASVNWNGRYPSASSYGWFLSVPYIFPQILFVLGNPLPASFGKAAPQRL